LLQQHSHIALRIFEDNTVNAEFYETSKKVKGMLSKILRPIRVKEQCYEVLFLQNGANEDVEVHQVKHVDFLTVKERLERGESVFITSKSAQKLVPTTKKVKHRSVETKMVTAFHFEPI